MDNYVFTKTNLSDSIYNILLERIQKLELAPGSKINISALQKEFNVSSAPVREALIRLVHAGLVETESFKGYKVYSRSKNDIEQLFEVRELLEINSLPKVIEKKLIKESKELIHLCESILKDFNEETVYEFERNFHEKFIINNSDNSYFINFYESITNKLELDRHIGGPQEIDLTEHIEILKNIIDGNVAEAQKNLYNHIDRSKNNILKNFTNK